MRIAIDARYLQADYTGIGVYSEGLLEAMAKRDHENEYIVLVHSSYRGELQLAENFEILADNARPISMRSIGTLAATLSRYRVDLLHSLFPLVPLLWRGKIIETVHDLQPLLDPLFSSQRGAIEKALYDGFYRFSYPACMRRADYIVTDSHATKEHMLNYMPELASKVLVIHGGVPQESFVAPSEQEMARVREKYDIPEKFLFYLGSTRPNKNLPMMLDAFEEFLKRHPEHDDLYWVLVVKPDRFFDPFFGEIRRRNLLRRIHIHEQVSESEKNVFYRLATLLYFVSTYEGFGLPVLEAQAMGLPVLASTHGALPEVAGSAALLADPSDADSITEAIEKFFYDPDLPPRMAEAGRKNVVRFTWDKAAKEVLDMYSHLLG